VSVFIGVVENWYTIVQFIKCIV